MMPSSMSWSEDTPWRQGAFLKPDTYDKLLAAHAPEKADCAIVVSHDCDNARPPEREQDVEFVFARTIPKIEGNFANAKNPRQLHIAADGGPEKTCVHLETKCRAFIPKTELENVTPCEQRVLTTPVIHTLQNWLASRYRRSALPNAFNNRMKLKKLPDKIVKAQKGSEDCIEAVLFDLDGRERDELAEEECYVLTITVLYNEEKDSEAHAKAAAVATDIQAAFDKAFEAAEDGADPLALHGIELVEATAVSVHGITFAAASKQLRFELDHISFKAGKPASTLEFDYTTEEE